MMGFDFLPPAHADIRDTDKSDFCAEILLSVSRPQGASTSCKSEMAFDLLKEHVYFLM